MHNAISADFTFRDGLIVRHHDVFDFWRWSSMALGLPGRLLGLTHVIKKAVRKETRAALDAYLAKNGG